ncbi:glycosyltransferase family 4 protein [Croceicoccus naphthovorans]|uniref:glycosyltransferase family 4 protein n=1 Tax=Croceicoccus naphthovorans TaxID=1348774 RepID=UPI00069FDC8F|nr:glycosyltransferase family 4 protein [Croceicoccus naphthovorans]MBB3990392.1 glycosyltransferase involved in cell wall biosynthesis [Croceicoccus naphthovorans]
MRIAILNTLYPPSTVGGAERSVAVLAQGLVAAGHQVDAIVLHDGAEMTTESVDGVTVHRLPHAQTYWPYDGQERGAASRLGWHWRARGLWAGMDGLARLLESIAPDAVHTNNLTGFGSDVIPMLRAMNLPVVHTLRDFGLVCARAGLFRDGKDCTPRCLSCRVLTRRRIKNAGGVGMVVGNSQFMIDRHRQEGLFADTPSRTIFNAVPGIGVPPEPTPRKAGQPLRIGFAGMVKAEKGIETLLSACRPLPNDAWTLTVAGRGEQSYVEGLKAASADLPVAWPGFVPIDRFFAELDLIVIPSIWPEPMPRVLIEAMAAGLPVIVSDAGGSAEVAGLYPHARLYDRGDVGALTGALQDAIRQGPKRHRPSKALLARFSVERLVDDYLDAYRTVIAAQGA